VETVAQAARILEALQAQTSRSKPQAQSQSIERGIALALTVSYSLGREFFFIPNLFREGESNREIF